jgi:hypothetical protein
VPHDDIKVSNDELLLIISALELAATLIPEALDDDPKLLSEKMTNVDSLMRRLMRIAIERDLPSTG